MVDVALVGMDELFSEMYSDTGRPSIAPERLLRAQTLQILYTARSERQLLEQIDFNLLFRSGLLVWNWTRRYGIRPCFVITVTGC